MQNISVPEQEKQNPKRFFGKLAIVVLLTIVYFYAGKLGLSLAFVNPSATAVWPPAGIALAAFLIFGEYVWPAILLGAFLVNITTSGSALPSPPFSWAMIEGRSVIWSTVVPMAWGIARA
jgi:integral membrane sensor domain MASE1